MTVKEAAEKSGLSPDRVRQFCKKFSIDVNSITEENYALMMARRHAPKVAK